MKIGKGGEVYLAVAALVVLVFAGDLALPLGTAIWVVYLLPVVLSYLAPNPLAPMVTAAMCVFSIVAGYFVDRPDIGSAVSVTNRSIGSIVLLILGVAGYWFIRSRVALALSDWLQEGQVAVARAAEGDVDLSVMSDRVLSVLAERLGARAALFYAGEGERFQRVAGYGLATDARVPDSFGPGESHLWRCVAQERRLSLDNLPPETALSFGSGLLQARAGCAVIAPVHHRGRVNGVLELGFTEQSDPARLAILDRIGDQIGMAVRSANDRRRLRELLEETQRQAEELKTHGEELAATNEELEEQTRALQESQRRLEQQQAELEEQNAQLESQKEQLESQRNDLARSQRLLEDQSKRLERESRYKSEFVANMSHELRTPLNALLIMARLLADNRARTLTDEQVGWAQTIESSGKDLLVLINDILDLSKVEAGKLDLSPETIRPAEVAEKLRRSFAPQAQAKRLALKTDIPVSLPEFETDRARLEQVLRNFVSNALKFTERGEIELSATRDGDGIVWSVRDTGIGIAEEDQETIFEAFRQADGTISRRYGGTGLGLSISRELAALLGGHITVSSAPERGSTFRLHLPSRLPRPDRAVAMSKPRARDVPPPAMSAPPKASVPRAPKPLDTIVDDRDRLAPGARIVLVVEDDPAFARILLDLSHELGLQCIVAGTAEDGVLAARQFVPHAIILDVGLPDYSGLSVLDRLKRDTSTRHIPVHMVSVEDYTREALSQGALSYILKPVPREKLIEALKSIESRLEHRMRRVLVVEDDPAQLQGLKALLGSDDVEVVGVATAADGWQMLKARIFDCLVLDLTLPDASGFDLLKSLASDDTASFPPAIVYTARALSEQEELQLRRYSKSIIIKGAKSPERLVDEVTLFLHQIVSELPERQQKLLAASLNRDAILEGRRILIVEDDIRNVYALTGVFEPHGAQVQIARNGREALDALGRVADSGSPGIDLVLMDVMMPEMDGLTATREIRRHDRWKALPIIMLTAKAMADDQEQCISAGANDYLAKPLDVDKLLSLVRVWMPR